MKKLLFGLIATVMLTASSYGQTFTKSKKTDRTFQLMNVIALLETKTEFSSSKTSDEFLKAVTTGITDQKYIQMVTPYINNVYKMHQLKYTQDNAYDKTDFAISYKTFNDVADYSKSNPEFVGTSGAAKFSWRNLLRKIIDIVLDELGIV